MQSNESQNEWRPDELQRRKEIEQGLAVVANHHADKSLIEWAKQNGNAVEIGRIGKFGNPFVLNQDGHRDAVCEAYEHHYLPYKPSLLGDIKSLRGKVLICFCHPRRCHGHTLAKLANGSELP